MERLNRRKVRQGIVVRTKMDKSVVVSVERVFQHPLYGKLVRKTSRVIAHDAENRCRAGDIVTIVETRPLSKHKRWRIREITSTPLEEKEDVLNGGEGAGDSE